MPNINWWYVLLSLYISGCTIELIVEEYKYHRRPAGYHKFGRPLNTWWLYYIFPLFVVFIPMNWFLRRKQEKEWIEEYERTGLIFWEYLERKYFSRDQQLDQLYSRVKAYSNKGFLSEAEICKEAVMDYLLAEGTSYLYLKQLNEGTVLVASETTCYLFHVWPKCNQATVSISSKILKKYRFNDIVRSHYERIWNDKQFQSCSP